MGTRKKFPDYAEALPVREGTIYDPVIIIESGGQDEALYGVGRVVSTLVDDETYDWRHAPQRRCASPTNVWTLSVLAADPATGENLPAGYEVRWRETHFRYDGSTSPILMKTEVLAWKSWSEGSYIGNNKQRVRVGYNPGRWFPRIEIWRTHDFVIDPSTGVAQFQPIDPVMTGYAEIHSFAVEDELDSHAPARNHPDVDANVCRGTAFHVTNLAGGKAIDAWMGIKPVRGSARGRPSLDGYPQNQYWHTFSDSRDLAQVVMVQDADPQVYFIQGYGESSSHEEDLMLIVQGQAFLEHCSACWYLDGSPVVPIWQDADKELFTAIAVEWSWPEETAGFVFSGIEEAELGTDSDLQPWIVLSDATAAEYDQSAGLVRITIAGDVYDPIFDVMPDRPAKQNAILSVRVVTPSGESLDLPSITVESQMVEPSFWRPFAWRGHFEHRVAFASRPGMYRFLFASAPNPAGYSCAASVDVSISERLIPGTITSPPTFVAGQMDSVSVINTEDLLPGQVTWEKDAYLADEDQGSLVVSVIRGGDLALPQPVSLTLAGGTADGRDLDLPAEDYIFPIGSDRIDIVLKIHDNDRFDGVRRVELFLRPIDGVPPALHSSTTVTLIDDDGAPAGAGDPSAAELRMLVDAEGSPAGLAFAWAGGGNVDSLQSFTADPHLSGRFTGRFDGVGITMALPVGYVIDPSARDEVTVTMAFHYDDGLVGSLAIPFWETSENSLQFLAADIPGITGRGNSGGPALRIAAADFGGGGSNDQAMTPFCLRVLGPQEVMPKLDLGIGRVGNVIVRGRVVISDYETGGYLKVGDGHAVCYLVETSPGHKELLVPQEGGQLARIALDDLQWFLGEVYLAGDETPIAGDEEDPIVVTLVADSNRDGRVDAADRDVELLRKKAEAVDYHATTGAIMLMNADADREPPQGRTKLFSDVNDTVVGGEDDLLDMVDLQLDPIRVPDALRQTAVVRISLASTQEVDGKPIPVDSLDTPGARRIRVFWRKGDVWTYLLGPGTMPHASIPQVDISSDGDHAALFRALVRDQGDPYVFKVEGVTPGAQVIVTVEILDRAGDGGRILGKDRVRMMVAPFLGLPPATPVQRVLIGGGGPWKSFEDSWLKAVALPHEAAGRFTQDIAQMGGFVVPWRKLPAIVAFSGASGANFLPYGIGFVTIPHGISGPTSLDDTPYNKGGNLECTPPISKSATSEAHPRGIWMAVSGIDQILIDFLTRQTVQGHVQLIDKGNLNVAHIDELVAFLPDGKIAVGDLAAARALVADPGTTFGGSAPITLARMREELAANVGAYDAVQLDLDAVHLQVSSAMGVDPGTLVKVPVLYLQHATLDKAVGTGLPNAINLQIVNQQIIYPSQQSTAFQNAVQTLLGTQAISISTLMPYYWRGNAHCASLPLVTVMPEESP